MCAFRTVQLAIDPQRYLNDLRSKINSNGETTLKLDSHADTCVLGRDALILLDFDQPVCVQGYDPTLVPRPLPPLAGHLPTMTLLRARLFTW